MTKQNLAAVVGVGAVVGVVAVVGAVAVVGVGAVVGVLQLPFKGGLIENHQSWFTT